MEDEKSVQISPVDEEIFWQNQDHWHLLDGFTEGGDPNGNPKPSTYKAYWNMIKNGEKSGKRCEILESKFYELSKAFFCLNR